MIIQKMIMTKMSFLNLKIEFGIKYFYYIMNLKKHMKKYYNIMKENYILILEVMQKIKVKKH